MYMQRTVGELRTVEEAEDNSVRRKARCIGASIDRYPSLVSQKTGILALEFGKQANGSIDLYLAKKITFRDHSI
jgi:hypothetical protein